MELSLRVAAKRFAHIPWLHLNNSKLENNLLFELPWDFLAESTP
jgi:hypothetical protein